MAKMIYCDAYRTLIDTLRRLREEQGLRQADVGEKLGLSADWVGKVEGGEIRLDLLHLVLLCRLYGAQPDELVRQFAQGLPD